MWSNLVASFFFHHLLQDACESIGVLPTLQIYIEELNQEEFNEIRGISFATKDNELFHQRGDKGGSDGGSIAKKRKTVDGKNNSTTTSSTKIRKKASQEGYFILR